MKPRTPSTPLVTSSTGRRKVLLLENIHPDAAAQFNRAGYTVETLPTSPTAEELTRRIRDVSILGIRSKTSITKAILDSAERLVAVGAFCIGTDHVDLATCTERGIAVFNAPYSNTRSVVELALAEMIVLLRNVFDKSVKAHAGVWDKSAGGCFEIRGKKLGIVGYGNIGSQLSVLAEALGMDVHFYDVVDRLALGNATKSPSLDALLLKCDIVTLHVDGRAANANLLGPREIARMKRGSILLNLSRGSVVDLAALAKHLRSGRIAGAAIDVYPREPRGNAEAFSCELQGIPNVILTPHVGGSTEEAQDNIGQFVTAKLLDFVNAGNTHLSVNLPQLQLPELGNAHRLIHIHENQPGVLAKINGILARHDINILGQYLKTNERVGYAITDVGAKYDSAVIEALKRVAHTITFRVLY